MRIALMVEGRTERVFVPHLRRFLVTRLSGRMPRIDPVKYDGRIPTGTKLKRHVERLLTGPGAADAVIALTDVYTGTREFVDAADAKTKMRAWVDECESRFHPHAAQYEFEAWLLPFWSDIRRLAGSNVRAPSGSPENVDHDNPPAHRIEETFRIGNAGRRYVKERDADRILRDNDLLKSANACPELKALMNTIIRLCDGDPIP